MIDASGRAYIELIKRAVSGYLQLGAEQPFAAFDFTRFYDTRAGTWKIDAASRPLTLLGKAQIDLIEDCVVRLEAEGIQGDFLEAGVWRGGVIALLRALVTAYGIDRKIHAADSFAGIPLNTRFKHDPVDLWPDRWAAGLDEVKANLERFGLLDDRIAFLPGLFDDTLPRLTDERFALVRLDSDSYDSVLTSLDWLYPRLSRGGIVIVDDWHLPGCRFAVDAYRTRHGIIDAVQETGGNGWWVKTQDYLCPSLPGID